MSYAILLWVHSWMRWLVVLALTGAVGGAAYGHVTQQPFTKGMNALRHWTATIGHLQLIVGLLLYFKSPVALGFWSSGTASSTLTFFGWVHALLMILALLVLTVGSAKAKRAPDAASAG